MKQSSLPYEQLRLPDPGPENGAVPGPERTFTEEEERELDRQDSKAGSNIIARAQAKFGGETVITHTAAVRFGETEKPVKPVKGKHRPGARAQAGAKPRPPKMARGAT